MPGSGKPVIVEFSLKHIPKALYPDRDEFESVLKKCRHFWQDNFKAVQFFDRALMIINKDNIPVLCASDYNTTGLTGSEKDHGSHWHNLIKSVGSSFKGAGAGGSFGIGKHAPYVCSGLRTLFYTTLDKDGKFAFQGVSKLVTHRRDDGETTQGTGYYGKKEKNNPIRDAEQVPAFFRRTKVGTDVFITGFLDEQDWQHQIIKSVAENYFVAIMREKLVVYVDGKLIDKHTLQGHIDKLREKDEKCLVGRYYQCMVPNKDVIRHKEAFEDLGELELFLLKGKQFPKKVAMVRSTGMKIFDKDRFQIPFQFAGVLIAHGEKLNDFLRAVEPPCHDKWEYERYEDNPSYARSQLNKLYSWLRDKVKQAASDNDAETLDIEGMSQFLPDDEDVCNSGRDNNDRGITSRPLVSPLRLVPPSEAKPNKPAIGSAATDGNHNEGNLPNHGSTKNDVIGGRAVGGTGTVNPRLTGRGSSVGNDNDGLSRNNNRRITLVKVRSFCENYSAGVYRLSFESEWEGTGSIVISIAGEDGKDPAPIKEAYINNGGSASPLTVSSPGVVGPVEMRKGVRTTISVKLEKPERYALEVAGYAN